MSFRHVDSRHWEAGRCLPHKAGCRRHSARILKNHSWFLLECIIFSFPSQAVGPSQISAGLWPRRCTRRERGDGVMRDIRDFNQTRSLSHPSNHLHIHNSYTCEGMCSISTLLQHEEYDYRLICVVCCHFIRKWSSSFSSFLGFTEQSWIMCIFTHLGGRLYFNYSVIDMGCQFELLYSNMESREVLDRALHCDRKLLRATM